MVTRPFRFAVQSMATGDGEALRTLARTAETLGYDELYSSDHVGLPDPFIPLAVAAEVTERLRVGPLVCNNELHHPVLLARTAATLDRLSGGRLVLGLGTGYARAEHDAIGVPLRPRSDRVDRLDESIGVLRALLGGGRVTLDGGHHHLVDAELGVEPVQHPIPLLIGGHGRRVVGLAGRHADIFQFMGMTHDDSGALAPSGFGLDDLRRRAEWLAESAGDRADSIERSALVQRTAIGTDVGDQLAEAIDRIGLSPDELADCPFVLIGSTEEVIDKLERLREILGISHYVVRDAEGFAPVVDALRGR